MTDEARPDGLLFSRVYIQNRLPLADSSRFRMRIATYFEHHMTTWNTDVGKLIERELGVAVPRSYEGFLVPRFLTTADIDDVLSAVTLVWLASRQGTYGSFERSDGWRSFVERAMREEHLAFRLDAKSGVHPLVDREFEKGKAATLACLNIQTLAAVAKEYERAHAALERWPPETKEAVRSTFEAAEILTKQLIDGDKVKRLGPAEIGTFIRPLVKEGYASDQPAIDSINQLLEGFSSWTNAAQLYRHGQKVKESAVPPFELAVAMISSGSTYIRLLVELGRKLGRFK